MKKLILYISVFALGLNMACDPLDETYDEIDAMATDPAGVQVIERTLSDDDYEFLSDEYDVAGYGNFNSEDEAKEYVPYLLENLYPQLTDGSSVTINYLIYRGNFANSETLNRVDKIEVKEDAFFNETNKASVELPKLAESMNYNPVDGQVQIFKYRYADATYTEDFNLLYENFEDIDTLGSDYDTISISGPQTWEVYSSSSGYVAAAMSGYDDGNQPNEDWFILPEIDLAGFTDPELRLTHVLNFLYSAVIGTDVAVMISTDYDGSNPASATWNNLTLDQWPSGSSYQVTSSKASLAAYAGQKVYIGFYYHSTTSYAPNWRLLDIEVNSIAVETKQAYYAYLSGDEAWEEQDPWDFFIPEASDYDDMDLDGYFSSDYASDDYLPQLLAMEYPYAQEEDEVVVLYDYFTSSTDEVQRRGDKYTFMNGVWNNYETVVDASLQFGKEDGVWVPDNTIRYTLTASDYTDIANNENLGSASARTNLSSYGNFNQSSWSKDEIVESINFILKQNFPNSEVGQKYLVTYDTYPGGLLEVHLVLDESGDYVELD